MIYTTDKGIRIKAKDGREPYFSIVHGRYYLWGYRWVKSTNKFSGNCNLHDAKSFTPEAAA